MSDLSRSTDIDHRAVEAIVNAFLAPLDRRQANLGQDLRALQALFDRYEYTENRK